VNIKLLETFVELAHMPHLRKLADRLHATPSALSMRVKSLEEQLGVELFTSDHKVLVLTDVGRRLLPYAEAAISALNEFRAAALEANEVGGVVRIGLIEAAVYTLLPGLVKRIESEFKKISVSWVVGLTVDLLEHLNRGEIDLVFSLDRQPQNPHAISEKMISLGTHWVAKTGLIKEMRDESSIFSYQILTPMSNTAPHDEATRTVQRMAFKYGINPTEIQLSSTPSISALIALIRNGIGIGVIPALLVAEELGSGELEILPVTPPPPMVVYSWHMKNASPATLRMVGLASEVAANMAGGTCDEDVANIYDR
jgi:DNA-binding transcriptional LysR family regulator